MQGQRKSFARLLNRTPEMQSNRILGVKNRVLAHTLPPDHVRFLNLHRRFRRRCQREGWILSELKMPPSPPNLVCPQRLIENFFQPRNIRECSSEPPALCWHLARPEGIHYFRCNSRHWPSLAVKSNSRLSVCIPPKSSQAYFPIAMRNRISSLPFLSRDAMPALYAAHDIFVFPRSSKSALDFCSTLAVQFPWSPPYMRIPT